MRNVFDGTGERGHSIIVPELMVQYGRTDLSAWSFEHERKMDRRERLSYVEERMQHLIRRYLDRELGRRGFIEGLAGMGFTLAAAKAFLEPLEASERAAVHPDAGAATTIEGTGGELVVAQA